MEEGREGGGKNERVVGGLGHVAVIVRVNGSLGSELSAEELNGSVGDDLNEQRSRGRDESEKSEG